MIIKNRQTFRLSNVTKSDEIIVGITSYPGRINYINLTLQSLFHQSLKPDIIYLVLCEKEFQNKEKDLPEFLIDLTKTNPNFKILWVKENLKQFKKNIPIIKKYKDRNDVVIFTADDDVVYDKKYIETVYGLFKLNNETEKTVITWDFPWNSVNKYLYKYEKKPVVVVGFCEAYRPTFFNSILLDITEEDINTKKWISEDLWVTYNLIQNHVKFKEFPYKTLLSLIKTDSKISNITPLYDIHVKTIDPDKKTNIKELYKKYYLKKPYDAIIALTSYENRISSTIKTIESIKATNTKYKYKYVVTICEKLARDPAYVKYIDELKNTEDVDILYVNTDYNVYKKILFAMNKYKTLPIISADDGVLYIKDFADILMDKHAEEPDKIIGYTHWTINDVEFSSGGFGVLFLPNCFLNYGIKLLLKYPDIINDYNDDLFYGILANELNIKYKFLLNAGQYPHYDFFTPINDIYKNNGLKNKTRNDPAIIDKIRRYVSSFESI